MPTYANSNATDVEVEGLRIPAKATAFVTTRNIVSLPSGVTLVAATPYYNPVLVSRLISGITTDTYAIPSSVNGVASDDIFVSILCYGGSATIALNAAGNVPVLNIVSGERVTYNITNRSIATIVTVSADAATKIKMDIYKGGLSFGKL